MAVLIEGISVVVRREAIARSYAGGWQAFVADVPNATLCANSSLARVGFMDPSAVKAFVERLVVQHGLRFSGGDTDVAVVDQLLGPTQPCGWLEFGHVEVDGHRVAACRVAGDVGHVLIRPDGWTYDTSLSKSYGFVPRRAKDAALRFVRREDGINIYLDLTSGKEVFVAGPAPTASEE